MAAYLIAVQCEDLAVEERQVLDRMNERMKARKKEEINLIPLIVFSPQVVLIMELALFNK